MQVLKQEDLAEDLIRDRAVAVLGYGNQGHAHALNLRDSGARVVVGARESGRGWQRARDDGFEVAPLGDAVAAADYVVMLLPDEIQGELFEAHVRAALAPDAALVFAHGYSVAFGDVQVADGHDVLLVAPKGQGHFVRRMYEEGKGAMALVAVESDASGRAFDKALSYAGALGCLRAGALRSSFREEAVTDLFGEQAVLCGGVPGLVKAAFDTLVAGGYSPEVAYIECMHELKIITDLMYSGGLKHMRDRISGTAAWGSYGAEEKLIDDGTKQKLSAILAAIESGEFASGWRVEARKQKSTLKDHMKNESQHPIEGAGREVRSLMPYLEEDET